MLLVLATSSGLAGQCQENTVKQLLRLLLVFGDVGILVETKHLRVGSERQGAEVFDVALILSVRRGFVQTTGRESSVERKQRFVSSVPVGCSHVRVILDDVEAVEDGEEGDEETTVPVICHSTSVVTLTSQVGERIQWQVLIVIQKHLCACVCVCWGEGGAR